MAPLAPNSTARVWIDYEANGRPHQFQLRLASPSTPPDSSYLESLDDWLISLNPLMPSDWAFLGARYAPLGADFSIPLAYTPTPFAGTASPSPSEAPAFYSFQARSFGGRRTSVTLLGVGFSPAQEGSDFANYRVTTAEDPALGGIIAGLASLHEVAIDGIGLYWQSYINAGYNGHFQRKSRAG